MKIFGAEFGVADLFFALFLLSYSVTLLLFLLAGDRDGDDGPKTGLP